MEREEQEPALRLHGPGQEFGSPPTLEEMNWKVPSRGDRVTFMLQRGPWEGMTRAGDAGPAQQERAVVWKRRWRGVRWRRGRSPGGEQVGRDITRAISASRGKGTQGDPWFGPVLAGG